MVKPMAVVSESREQKQKAVTIFLVLSGHLQAFAGCQFEIFPIQN